jgi:Ser-tRNA(Ala) deacylase AlaX
LNDPYLTETTAVITTANQNKITLNKTVAYAVSGGQDSKKGFI